MSTHIQRVGWRKGGTEVVGWKKEGGEEGRGRWMNKKVKERGGKGKQTLLGTADARTEATRAGACCRSHTSTERSYSLYRPVHPRPPTSASFSRICCSV